MKITRDEARRIAGLAHLEFDEPGLERIQFDAELATKFTAMMRARRGEPRARRSCGAAGFRPPNNR